MLCWTASLVIYLCHVSVNVAEELKSSSWTVINLLLKRFHFAFFFCLLLRNTDLNNEICIFCVSVLIYRLSLKDFKSQRYIHVEEKHFQKFCITVTQNLKKYFLLHLFRMCGFFSLLINIIILNTVIPNILLIIRNIYYHRSYLLQLLYPLSVEWSR